METQKKIAVITKELRVDNVGIYEVTFVNNKVVMIKDINGFVFRELSLVKRYNLAK